MASKRAQLSEIMGKKGAEAAEKGLSMDNLGDLLGEAMPELPRNTVGRFRLIRALKQRFGDGFRNLPGLKGIITDFDEQVKFEGKISQMKKIGKK